MAKSKKEIIGILNHLKDSDFNYEDTCLVYKVNDQWLMRWWVMYAEELFGTEIAMKHQPFARASVSKAANDAKRLAKKDEGALKKRTQEILTKAFREEKDLAIAPQILRQELSVTEAASEVAIKAANVKLAAIERLELMIDSINPDQLLKAIEVLHKIQEEPKEEVRQKANSFMQLVQKQIIINKNPQQ